MKETFIQQEAEQQKEPVQADISAGDQLAALRNAMGWSVEQVAEQLKLAPRQIVAIEQNDYAALPGMAVTRGFIRIYARLLKTDAAPLLAALPGETPATSALPTSRPDLSTPFSETRTSFIYRRGGSSKSLVGAALLLALLIAVLAVFGFGWRPALLDLVAKRMDKQASSTATTVVADNKVVAETPRAESKPAVDASAVTSAPLPAPTPAPVSVEPVAAATTPAAVPSAPTGTAAAPDTASAKKNDVLVLTLHEDSWVQIKRSDASTLVSRILKAGETASFEITEPVLLTVGNAAGVEATLRGVPLNMKPKSNSNTVRLKLE